MNVNNNNSNSSQTRRENRQNSEQNRSSACSAREIPRAAAENHSVLTTWPETERRPPGDPARGRALLANSTGLRLLETSFIQFFNTPKLTFPKTGVHKLLCVSEPSRGLAKTRTAEPPLQSFWDRVQKCVFLTSPWVVTGPGITF